MTEPLHVLTLSCPDQPGVVARVTGLLFDAGGNIREAAQFEDAETGRFFMRVVFALPAERAAALTERFGTLAHRDHMVWSIRRADTRRRATNALSGRLAGVLGMDLNR